MLLTAVAGCAASSPRRDHSGSPGVGPAPPATIVPRGPAAVLYGAQAPRPSSDPLRQAIVDDVFRVAAASGAAVPREDTRLDAAMDDLARDLGTDDRPSSATVDFLLAHYGVVEPMPHLLLVTASPGGDLALRELVEAQLPAALRGAPARVGVGVDRSPSRLAVVVGLQEQNVDLAPIGRVLVAGGSAAVAGRLLRGHRNPHVTVTAPSGAVHEVATRSDGAAFDALFRCDRGNGRYQVEVGGEDKLGPAIVANFPVFCGVDPPREMRRAPPIAVGSLDPAEAEREMHKLVNRDRAAARLPTLAWDGDLAAVARAHSRDMADHDFVGHISPRTGTTVDRVRRAGVTYALVLENVGSGLSIEEVGSGLMQSPGHRANIIDRRVTRLGVGVALGDAVTGMRSFYVTQLFRD